MNKSQYIERRLPKQYFFFAILGGGCLIAALVLAFLVRDDIFSRIFPLMVLLIAALVCLVFAIRQIGREESRLFQFIKENSKFAHKTETPLTPQLLIERLKNMGFSIAEYPMENYLCVKEFEKGYECNLFLSNFDTPECEEAEGFSEIFVVETMKIFGQSNPKTFCINLILGDMKLESINVELHDTLKQGVLRNKQGVFFGFTAAYDTNQNTLYCADAVTQVKWREQSVIAHYITTIVSELFQL